MPIIPVSYLFDSSKQMLGEYELSRRNHAANLKKQLRVLVDQIIDDAVEAEFARWMLDNREELCFRSVSLEVKQEIFDFVARK